MARRLALVSLVLAAISRSGVVRHTVCRRRDLSGSDCTRSRANFNSSTVDGHGPEARARQLGAYFTDDAEVDLGRGAVPIKGRETLIGMAGRLQPRTSAFDLRFEDITVAMAPGGRSADVHLTAEFCQTQHRDRRPVDRRA